MDDLLLSQETIEVPGWQMSRGNAAKNFWPKDGSQKDCWSNNHKFCEGLLKTDSQ